MLSSARLLGELGLWLNPQPWWQRATPLPTELTNRGRFGFFATGYWPTCKEDKLSRFFFSFSLFLFQQHHQHHQPTAPPASIRAWLWWFVGGKARNNRLAPTGGTSVVFMNSTSWNLTIAIKTTRSKAFRCNRYERYERSPKAAALAQVTVAVADSALAFRTFSSVIVKIYINTLTQVEERERVEAVWVLNLTQT